MGALMDNSKLKKGWTRYTIMHKDRRVVSVREDGSCKIYSRQYMPYNLYLDTSDDDISTRVDNLNNFYYWCSSRVLTLDRKYAKEMLNSIGAKQANTDKERAMITISYHGVCLTDNYWIKSNREAVNYSDINLFTHSLSDAFADVSLFGTQLTAQNAELIDPKEVAGDVGTLGVAPKAWIRDGKSFFLLKDGEMRDVDAELLASKIIDCFNVGHVSYKESFFNGKKVSKSRIITSESLSLVPIEYVEIYCTNKDTNLYDFVKNKDSYSYFMMNIVDYLVGNTDRHWGNWGFYADENNKLTKLYPLMDFNKSFLSYDSVEGARCQTTEKNLSQKDAAIEAVKKIGLNQIKEVNPEWFNDKNTKEMFFKRLDILKNAENY